MSLLVEKFVGGVAGYTHYNVVFKHFKACILQNSTLFDLKSNFNSRKNNNENMADVNKVT